MKKSFVKDFKLLQEMKKAMGHSNPLTNGVFFAFFIIRMDLYKCLFWNLRAFKDEICPTFCLKHVWPSLFK